jgi:transposase
MHTSFSRLSLNTLYNIGDSLRRVKEPLEAHLRQREQSLFSFADTVVLYDLTNVYYEGAAQWNKKAKKGRSKDRRSDCPLITLGVVYNPQGFPLSSDIFEGNISEPKTLEIVLKRMPINLNTIVVLDGGLGTEENLKWLRSQGMRYIVCSRKRQHIMPDGLPLQYVKQKEGQSVYAASMKAEETEETLVYCKSEAKSASEEKWKRQVQANFEKALQKIADGLHKKGARSGYRPILERIGRLKERYARIAQFYSISIQADEKTQKVQSLSWEFNLEKAAERFDGGYCLRVFGLEWGCQQLWDTYIMLTKAEEGFRCLKGQLGLRPVFHRKETRADSHLFITLLAYHVMQSVLFQLEQKGIFLRWEKLRRHMSTHLRITTSFQTKEGKKIHIRSTSNPESFHTQIYSALGIDPHPIKKTKTIL